jgi:hypothetical protein
VVTGEVLLERCFSRCTLICACASANFFLSVENDPDGGAVVAASAQVESRWQSASGHGGLTGMVVAAVTIALTDSTVT